MSWKHFLLSLDGRIHRSAFWLKFQLPAMFVSVIFSILDALAGLNGLLSALYLLAILWPSIAVGVKRLHDRNRSGWFLLLSLIPVLGQIWYLIDVGIMRGTEGENRFGPDPLEGPDALV